MARRSAELEFVSACRASLLYQWSGAWVRETARPHHRDVHRHRLQTGHLVCEHGNAELDRELIEDHLADVADAGSRAPWRSGIGRCSTSRSGWPLRASLTADPMVGVQSRNVPEDPVPILTPDDLRALLATCKGVRSFAHRRDTAIISAGHGDRLAEMTGLGVAHLDMGYRVALCSGGQTAVLMPSFVTASVHSPRHEPSRPNRLWFVDARMLSALQATPDTWRGRGCHRRLSTWCRRHEVV
jgi:integrase